MPSVEDCATDLDEDCDGETVPCPGAVLWSKHLHAPAHVRVAGVAGGLGGEVVVGGGAIADLEVGGALLAPGAQGERDPFVARYDAEGGLLHADLFVASGVGQPHAVVVGPGGEMVLGGHFIGQQTFGGPGVDAQGLGDAFVAAFNGAGSDLWHRVFSGPGFASVSAMAADGSGGLVVVGDFRDTLTVGQTVLTSVGQYDIFVARLDATGAVVWAKGFGATNDQFAKDVAVDTSTGRIAVTGGFFGSLDLGGGLMTTSGNLVRDVYLAVFDLDGTYLTGRHLVGESFSDDEQVAWAPDGSLYLAGQSYGALDFGAGPVPGVGQADIYVARYAASGELDWVQRFGDGLTLAFVKGLAVNDVGVAVAGHFDGAITVGDTHHVSGPGSDALVAWLSTESGTPWWSRTFGGEDTAGCSDVALTTQGRIAVVGQFAGTLPLDDATYQAT
ncbi:MAG: hypothetical protein KC656_30560, partial [Myxococcales bacterium]|nr:hypothetical protein [Myxococcales bacterium]